MTLCAPAMTSLMSSRVFTKYPGFQKPSTRMAPAITALTAITLASRAVTQRESFARPPRSARCGAGAAGTAAGTGRRAEVAAGPAERPVGSARPPVRADGVYSSVFLHLAVVRTCAPVTPALVTTHRWGPGN